MQLSVPASLCPVALTCVRSTAQVCSHHLSNGHSSSVLAQGGVTSSCQVPYQIYWPEDLATATMWAHAVSEKSGLQTLNLASTFTHGVLPSLNSNVAKATLL